MMYENKKTVYAVSAPVVFPEGFSVCSAGKGNALEIERNGEGAPVLRGSSIAGVLRSAVAADPLFAALCENYFGKALTGGDERQESAIVFHDMAFEDRTNVSMHNLICRHTGSVSQENKGLFSIERTAPGVTGELFFTLAPLPGAEDPGQDEEFLDFLISLLKNGILTGGNSNRGGGRCLLQGEFYRRRKFDLTDIEDAAAYLDLLYDGKKELLPQIALPSCSGSSTFAVKLELGIPRGQDILLAEGMDMFPAMVCKSDGKNYWKIPGSSFRGVFRSWFSRLAARDGKKLVDSVERYRREGVVKSDKIYAGGTGDVISSLFGSLEKRGRIHIADACSVKPAAPAADTRYRPHVAIDRFTGGTNEGKLFFNFVLTGDVKFTTVITIADPGADEIGYLQKTLQALHCGVLRLGSSKGAGRLEILSYEVTANPCGAEFALKLKGAEK